MLRFSKYSFPWISTCPAWLRSMLSMSLFQLPNASDSQRTQKSTAEKIEATVISVLREFLQMFLQASFIILSQFFHVLL